MKINVYGTGGGFKSFTGKIDKYYFATDTDDEIHFFNEDWVKNCFFNEDCDEEQWYEKHAVRDLQNKEKFCKIIKKEIRKQYPNYRYF